MSIEQPNILLIVMDSVRAENVSCYGYARNTTPHLDRLAEEGMVFKKAISIGCWTLPVHASLFTGLHPSNHGVNVSKGALPTGFPTLAAHLREQGYQTASFSNNAYISSVTNLTQGFDTVEDIWHVSKPRGIERTRFSKIVKKLEQYGAVGQFLIRRIRFLHRISSSSRRRRTSQDAGAHLTNEKICSWINEIRDPTRPFFIFANFMETHEPYNPPFPFDREFIPIELSSRRLDQLGNKDSILKKTGKSGELGLEILRALYDGAIRYLDSEIGQLVDFIDGLGILDNTMIIITSDHGDSLGEHDHLGHRVGLYDELIHVPLIIRYPARFGPGLKIRHQVSLIDLYPTILEQAGHILPAAGLNGFFSLTSPPSDEERPFVIAENTNPKRYDSVTEKMLRTDQYKFIWRSNQRHELYDLVNDPDEEVNIIEIETAIASELMAWLESWQTEIRTRNISVEEAKYDAALLERLRELGYVD